MHHRHLLDLQRSITGFSGAFFATGSFGTVDGRSDDLPRQVFTREGVVGDYPAFRAECRFSNMGDGVTRRQDTLLAKQALTLQGYLSRFQLEGGDWEVYTQYNAWQRESTGGFAPLRTTVEAENTGLRTSDGAAPMAVLRNRGNGRMLVFHLAPNAAWRIRISRRPMGDKYDGVLVELGWNDRHLHMHLQPGEQVDMPEIFFFRAESALDFDAWRLHAVMHRLHPQKALPVLFNTWMANFDMATVEGVKAQADAAADLGIEMFLLDAGWFGRGDHWWECIGDWRENTAAGFRGRLAELSEYIRSRGLIFGLWMEPERALSTAPIAKEHPEYFRIGSGTDRFLDFAREDARQYILGEICRVVDTYHVGFLKFDFNASLAYDEDGDGFYRYLQGQKQLVRTLRQRYPALYITNCASGGHRMDISQLDTFDSVWISDDQSPLDGLRIAKDTLLRMPPCHLEKWDVRRFADGFMQYGDPARVALPFSCNGATWDSCVTVTPSFTHGYISGGVMGFSAEIADYPAAEKDALRALIARHKADREFYKRAVVRILHDTAEITVLQYSDLALTRSLVYTFCRQAYQPQVTVYPAVAPGMRYTDESGAPFDPDAGMAIPLSDYACTVRSLCALC